MTPRYLFTLFDAALLPRHELEYRFRSDRRWRFDLAWPWWLLAVEIEGGVWSKGRHIRPKGFLADMEKYNAATIDGWRVLRYTPAQLTSTVTMEEIRAALKGYLIRWEGYDSGGGL